MFTANESEPIPRESIDIFSVDRFYDRIMRSPISKTIETYKTARVLVIGMGGLGLPVAEALVRSTMIRELAIIDDDVLQQENLNRIGTVSELGEPKVEVAYRRLVQIRPINVIKINDKFTKDYARYLYRYNLIFDETDTLELLPLLLKYKTSNNAIISIKYDGFSRGTVFVNAKPFYFKPSDRYEIEPSTVFTANAITGLALYYILSHPFWDIVDMKKVISIDISKMVSWE